MRSIISKIINCCLYSFIFLFSGVLFATHHLAPNHPDIYVVQEGDTLWEIAGRFLAEPWRWPELWRASEYIDNPHLIYPGDVIVLRYEGDAPYLYLERDYNRFVGHRGSKVRLSPRVRSKVAEKAIPSLPMNVIGPFMNNSRVLPREYLKNASEIVAVDDSHLLVGEGYKFYANVQGANVGDVYSVYKEGQDYVHPETGCFLGLEAKLLGHAEVVQAGEISTLVLKKGFEEIKIGDKLCPYEEEKVDFYFYPKYPKNEARGYILSVLGGLNHVSQYQVVAITGGYNINRRSGDVLSIYQTNSDIPLRIQREEEFIDFTPQRVHRSPFLPQIAGRVVVFKVFHLVSFALVTNATKPIYLQDVVEKP